MNIAKHTACIVSIIAEKVIDRPLLKLLDDEGAKGYTIYEGGGNGSFHSLPSQHPALSEAMHIIKIEAIISEKDIAERIATRVVQEFFTDRPGVVYIKQAEIFRPEKF